MGVGELAFQRNHQVIEEFGRGHGQDPVLELADMQNPVTQVTPVNWNGLEPLPQRSRYRNGKGNSLLINKVMANKTETVGLGDDIEGRGCASSDDCSNRLNPVFMDGMIIFQPTSSRILITSRSARG